MFVALISLSEAASVEGFDFVVVVLLTTPFPEEDDDVLAAKGEPAKTCKINITKIAILITFPFLKKVDHAVVSVDTAIRKSYKYQ
jgi:hypothetical protein